MNPISEKIEKNLKEMQFRVTSKKEIVNLDPKNKSILNHPDVAKMKNREGYTPLHIAAKYHPEVSKHPEASKVVDKSGATPLHHAAEWYHEVLTHPDVAKVKDNNGNTPLHIAAFHHPEASKHPDFAKVKNNNGMTPKDHADQMKAIHHNRNND